MRFKPCLASTVLLGLALSITAGCAPRRAPTTVPAPAAAPEQAPEPPPDPAAPGPLPLYDALRDQIADYELGIALLAAGDEVQGEERIVAASRGIRSGIDRCASLPACDLDRFVDAYERLLTEHGIALKRKAARLDELEADIAAYEEEQEEEPGTESYVTPIPQIERTASLLRGTDIRELIRLNGPVKAALDDWLTWMRPMLMSSYENYQYLREEIAPIYEEAGLPEALLFAMMATETGVKVHATSRAGASGPLQFMRSTGRKYGLTERDGFDLRFDPTSSTRANVAYLNDQFAALNEDLEKALAAYNGGENRVQGLHRRLNGTGFWDSSFYYALPRETREYVPRILAAAWLYLHPEDYGLEFPTYDVTRVDLGVRRETSLGELTICLGQEGNRDGWYRTLRNLNPRIDPGDRIPAGSTLRVPAVLAPIYERRCLDGDLLARGRELFDANYPEEPDLIVYHVRRGDTLGTIASRHRCVSLAQLAAINGIRPPRYVIHPGQQLKIPDCP